MVQPGSVDILESVQRLDNLLIEGGILEDYIGSGGEEVPAMDYEKRKDN